MALEKTNSSNSFWDIDILSDFSFKYIFGSEAHTLIYQGTKSGNILQLVTGQTLDSKIIVFSQREIFHKYIINL